MTKRQLFTITTPLGYRVSLSRDRWKQITRFKHPAMLGRERDVRNCLHVPEVVRESTKDPNVHVYYRSDRGVAVCVVVAPTGGDGADRFVVTAYLTERIKEGKQLWTR